MNWVRTGRFVTKDEYYTPPILTELIAPYVPKGVNVWHPFDTPNSEFVHTFNREHRAMYSHLWLGQDFFKTDIRADCVVSNPPFTRKLDVFKRLYALGVPFAMLMNLTILNHQEVGEFFLYKELQLLIPDKKVSFDGNTSAFNVAYFCWRLLPRDLIFAHLPHNNTGANFVGSRMSEDAKEWLTQPKD